MSNFYRYTLVFSLALVTLACGLITAPISEAKNLASTAQAMATDNPLQTLEALPSAIPDVGQYLNPTGAPAAQWKDIPVMPQATAGQEFNDKVYSFKIDASVDDVQNFYKNALTPLGWNQSFSAQSGSGGGVTFFSKDSSLLTITITPREGSGLVVVLLAQ